MPNFSVYEQRNNWTPADFDTGTDKVFASLANIPRQIFEGIYAGKESRLKERSMADKEDQSRLAWDKERADQEYQKGNLDLQERHLAQQNEQFETTRKDNEVMRKLEEDNLRATTAFRRQASQEFNLRRAAAEKDKNIAGLKYVVNQERESKRRDLVSYLGSNTIFSNPELDKEFKSSLVINKNADAIYLLKQIAFNHRDDKILYDTKALSVLAPMIEDFNNTNVNWYKLHTNIDVDAQTAPQSIPNVSNHLLTNKLYESSLRGIDPKDPVYQTAFRNASALTQDKGKLLGFQAAIVDNLMGRPANAAIYDMDTYKFGKQIIQRAKTEVLRGTEVGPDDNPLKTYDQSAPLGFKILKTIGKGTSDLVKGASKKIGGIFPEEPNAPSWLTENLQSPIHKPEILPIQRKNDKAPTGRIGNLTTQEAADIQEMLLWLTSPNILGY